MKGTSNRSVSAEPSQAAGGADWLVAGGLWIGQHAGDDDILVFDPAESDPAADVLSFYSLTQLRVRSFPRSIATQKIHEVTDEIRSARARKEYGRRAELRAAREDAMAGARAERAERQREQVLDTHRQYLEALGIEYQGVQETSLSPKRRRRLKCYSCGIQLDDFAGVACVACGGVLCSCGACSCGGSLRSRRGADGS